MGIIAELRQRHLRTKQIGRLAWTLTPEQFDQYIEYMAWAAQTSLQLSCVAEWWERDKAYWRGIKLLKQPNASRQAS